MNRSQTGILQLWLMLTALLVFPPLAIWMNHDIISLVLIIVWFFLIVPIGVLKVVDFVRSHPKRNEKKSLRAISRTFVVLVGVLSFVLGALIILWCLYNVFVYRLLEYNGPSFNELILEGFGIAVPLIAFGWSLIRLGSKRPSN